MENSKTVLDLCVKCDVEGGDRKCKKSNWNPNNPPCQWGIRCALCGGDGLDKTGLATNGWTGAKSTPFCVRCGGWGVIPKGSTGRNPPDATEKELAQLKREGAETPCPSFPAHPEPDEALI